MQLSKHCELCNHQIKSLKEGTICGINNKKPSFNKTCIKIKIEDKGEARIKKINLDYELIKKAKATYFNKAILNYGIGLVLLFSGFFLSKLSLENKIFAKATFVIMGGGIIPFVKATSFIKEFNETYRENKRKKLELDSLLKLYDIKYPN